MPFLLGKQVNLYGVTVELLKSYSYTHIANSVVFASIDFSLRKTCNIVGRLSSLPQLVFEMSFYFCRPLMLRVGGKGQAARERGKAPSKLKRTRFPRDRVRNWNSENKAILKSLPQRRGQSQGTPYDWQPNLYTDTQSINITSALRPLVNLAPSGGARTFVARSPTPGIREWKHWYAGRTLRTPRGPLELSEPAGVHHPA